MLGVTHILFGLLVGTLFAAYYGQNPFFLLFAVLGALLPDIDHPKSFLGRYVKPVSWFSTHRGFFHSLLGGVVFTILLFIVTDALGYGPLIPLVFLFGYLTHLLLDGSTKAGIFFLWPAAIKFRGHRTVGSWPEKILQILIIVFLVWYWL